MSTSKERKERKKEQKRKELVLGASKETSKQASAAGLIAQQRVLVANAERMFKKYEQLHAGLNQDQEGWWLGPNNRELNAEWRRLRHIVKEQQGKLTDMINRYGIPSAKSTAGNHERPPAQATQVIVGTGLGAYGHIRHVGENGYLRTLSEEELKKAASALLGVPLTSEQMELFAYLKTSEFCTDCKLNKFCFLCRLERSMQGNARPELEICFMFDRETGKATGIETLFSPANCSCRSMGCDSLCRTCNKYEYEQTHCLGASAIDHFEHDCVECCKKKDEFECSRNANNTHHFSTTWQDPVHPDILEVLRNPCITKRCKSLFEIPHYLSFRPAVERMRKSQDFEESSAEAKKRVESRSARRNHNFRHPDQGQ